MNIIFRSIINEKANYDRVGDVLPFPTSDNPFCIQDISGVANEVTMVRSDANAPAVNLEYSYDNLIWKEWNDIYNTAVALPSNGKVYFRGTNQTFGKYNYRVNTFKIKGNCNLLGDLTTLLIPAGGVLDLTGRDYVFADLFEKNATIINAKDLILPSDILSTNCCEETFKECINLLTPPVLLATKLSSWCYAEMFLNCESLLYPPELPAKKIDFFSYSYMLSGCKSIIQPPLLLATELSIWCYAGLLYNCENLESAPYLPAETLVDGCYRELLWGCKKIKEVNIKAKVWSEKYSENWLNGVAPTGTLYKSKDLIIWDGTGTQPDGSIPINSPSGIPTGWTVEEKKEITPFCIEDISGVANEVRMTRSDEQAPVPNLQYSYDNLIWKEWDDIYNTAVALPSNGKVYFRGTNDVFAIRGFNKTLNNTLRINNNCKLSGDLTSLLVPEGGVKDLRGRDYVFSLIFENSKTIIDAKDLLFPSEILSSFCYYGIFYKCENLLYSPKILPATELAEGCYDEFFYFCTSLISSPQLPALQLKKLCYNLMFYYCISLVSAPYLPSTELAEDSYENMFYHCNKIKEVTIGATKWNYKWTIGWLAGTAPSGKINKPAELQIWDGTGEQPVGSIPLNSMDGIPKDWTYSNF